MVPTALMALMVPRPMARTAVQLGATGGLPAAAAMAPRAAAGGATLWPGLSVQAVMAATVGRLRAAARVVAGARRAVTAARRPEEMAASEDLAGLVATAAPCWGTPRPAALAARPVIRERA